MDVGFQQALGTMYTLHQKKSNFDDQVCLTSHQCSTTYKSISEVTSDINASNGKKLN